MRFKVELIYVDQNDKERDVSYVTYIDATSQSHAVDLAKQKQPIERPDLKPTDRWAWSVFQTAEEDSGI